MNDVVDVVLPCRVAVRIEVSNGIIRATEDRNSNFTNVLSRARCRLCPSNRALLVAIAKRELVVVPSERSQSLGFDFDRVVDVGRSIGSAAISWSGEDSSPLR